ncbi:MAG: PotD/PotF family extracellular solute-binding protein [Gemmataceae bacterium]|nr:PotD/PotF family extracellular solute-binding protein [Gemmataceae bacterium]
MNRRIFLMAAGLAALGCGRSSPRKLRVFCYAGGHDETMRRVFLPAFKEATGREADLHPGWWDGIARLKAAEDGEPPFDLMICDATQGYPALEEGLFAPLSLSNIPAVQALPFAALDNPFFKEKVGVTYPDSVMTLAYRRGAGKPPATWADLFQPGFSGKVGLYSSFYMSLHTFACARAAMEGKPGTAHAMIENDLDGVFEFAVGNRERVNRWWKNSAEMILALSNGDCAAGNMHSPEYLAALREKPALAAAVPPTDRAYVQVFWAVPKGCKEQELAERAIDVLFSPEGQEGFARRGMAAALPAVAAKVAAEDERWASLYPHTEEQFRQLRYYPYEAYARDWDDISDRWDRTVLNGP